MEDKWYKDFMSAQKSALFKSLENQNSYSPINEKTLKPSPMNIPSTTNHNHDCHKQRNVLAVTIDDNSTIEVL
jgi:hypothetical protein